MTQSLNVSVYAIHADGLTERIAPLTYPLSGNAELVGDDLAAFLVLESGQQHTKCLLSVVSDEVPRDAGRCRGLHDLLRVLRALRDDLVQATRGARDLRLAVRTRLRLLAVAMLTVVTGSEGEAVGSAVGGVQRLVHGVLRVRTTYTVAIESGPEGVLKWCPEVESNHYFRVTNAVCCHYHYGGVRLFYPVQAR